MQNPLEDLPLQPLPESGVTTPRQDLFQFLLELGGKLPSAPADNQTTDVMHGDSRDL